MQYDTYVIFKNDNLDVELMSFSIKKHNAVFEELRMMLN